MCIKKILSYRHIGELFGKKQEESILLHETANIDNQGDDSNKDVEQNVVRDEYFLQKKSKECTSDNIDIK